MLILTLAIDIDKPLSEADFSELRIHNEAFKLKREKIDDSDKLNPPDYSEDVEYDEQANDIYNWIRKILTDWEQDIEGKEHQWKNTMEGRRDIETYRDSKRSMMNLSELLVNKVTPC